MRKLYNYLFLAAISFLIINFSTVKALNNGWYEDETGKYYIENGSKVQGFKTIENKTYFFSYINGALKKGLQGINGKLFYLNDDGTVFSGFKTIDKNTTYYFSPDEYFAYNGFHEINGKTYFFSNINYVLKKGLQGINGKLFYLNDDGTVFSGFKAIDKNTTYYFSPDEYFAYNGFHKIGEKTYFFSNINYVLKYGWQSINGNLFYQENDGSVAFGLKKIDNKIYYFDKNSGFALKGNQTVDGQTYYFDPVTCAATTGWQEKNNQVFYVNDNGTIAYGWKTIANQKYYFGSDSYAVKGFQTIDGQTYFFSNINYVLKYGWQSIDSKPFYLDKEGKVLPEGWQKVENHDVYVVNHFNLTGIQTIENNTYLFDFNKGFAINNWYDYAGKTYYADPQTKIIAQGWTTINNKTYYFNPTSYTLTKGFLKLPEGTYYLDSSTGEKKFGIVKYNANELHLNEQTGVLEKIQYIPVYYDQKDSRWANIKLGLSTIGSSGCSPASMAMAFTSILGREILPVEVANYLYYNTDQYNKRLKGTSGKGIIYAADYYNVKYTGLSTKEEFVAALKDGKIVYAAMGNGKFATLNWNHAILLFKYDEKYNNTFAHDPLNRLNNTWHSVNDIWNEQSKDPDDKIGGYTFYALEAK